MPCFRLELRLRAVEGALARVLDLVERRGLTLVSLVATARGCAGQLDCVLVASGATRPEMFEAQLLRLADCRWAECRPAPPTMGDLRPPR